MAGPLGTPCNIDEIDSGTLERTRTRPRGVIGKPAATEGAGEAASPAFVVHLDLDELVEIEQPLEGKVRKGGTGAKVDVFVKGGVLQKDPGRPKKILAVVQDIFAPLADVIMIELDTPKASDRLLRAQFGWPLTNHAGKPQMSKGHGQFLDPSYVGVGAQGKSRTRLEKFSPVKGDAKKGVTAYIFEGAIAIVVMDFFGGKANLINLFATAIAHEVGHNVGLPHTSAPSDIMFVYAGKSERDQKKWMQAAEKGTLRFKPPQLASIRKLVRTP